MVNFCDSSPCEPRFSKYCKSDENEYICECTEKRTGKNCEFEQKPCRPDPCKNNGYCEHDEKTDSEYCVCPYGFKGVDCGMKVGICELDATLCSKQGVCRNVGLDNKYRVVFFKFSNSGAKMADLE